MAKMTKKIDVVAPPDRIYGTLNDPNAMPLFVPAVTNVSNVQKTDKRIGDTFRATYGLMGMHFDLTFTDTENAPAKRIARRFEGAMKGSLAYTLEPHGNSTQVKFDVDYTMSGGVLGKAMDKLLVERMNEKNAERMLENLKMMMETR